MATTRSSKSTPRSYWVLAHGHGFVPAPERGHDHGRDHGHGQVHAHRHGMATAFHHEF